MKAIKVKVVGGKLIGDAPPGFAEGEEVELCLFDPGDDMTDEELGELNRALEQAWECVQRGEVRSAAEVLGDLPPNE